VAEPQKVPIGCARPKRSRVQYDLRLQQFKDAIPGALTASAGLRCLYVGAKVYEAGSKRGFQIGADLVSAGWDVDVLEAHRPNALSFRKLAKDGRSPVRVIHGDVRDIDDLIPPLPIYDLVMHWHGPEHLNREEVEPSLNRLALRSCGMLVVACPWGRYDQGPAERNAFERHLCHLDETDLEGMGLRWSAIGRKGVPKENNLMGWRVLREANWTPV